MDSRYSRPNRTGGLKRYRPSAGGSGGSAELPDPRFVQTRVVIADHLAPIDVLRGLAEFVSSRLDQQAGHLALLQAERERYSSRSRADDAHARPKPRASQVLDVSEEHQSCLDSTQRLRMTTDSDKRGHEPLLDVGRPENARNFCKNDLRSRWAASPARGDKGGDFDG